MATTLWPSKQADIAEQRAVLTPSQQVSFDMNVIRQAMHGGYAELWNEGELYRLHAAVKGKSALMQPIRAVAA